MAQRFGGRFSPTPQDAPPGSAPVAPPMRTRAGMRVNLLFLAPLPLAVRAFVLPATALVQTLAALGLLLLAAWLTREGEIAHEAWDARKIARRPAFPRKLAASVLTGAGLALAALPDNAGLLGPLALGLAGTVLHVLSFGPDPLSDKGMEGIDVHAQDRAARAVEDAEAHLAAMKDAILRARDRSLEARIERFQATARAMFRRIEEDPRDLTASRKYLSVYLMGARDATAKFADLYATSRDARARADYEALLGDLETSFGAHTQALLSDNRDDLDVEIAVLRERLEREGIKAS